MPRPPITIVYYEPSSGYGGSARCLRDWLSHLDRSRFRPVVACSDHGSVIKDIEASEPEFYRLGNADSSQGRPAFLPEKIEGYGRFLFHALTRMLPEGIRLVRIIRRAKADVLHINTPIRTGLPGVLAAALTGVPCVCHLHDTRPWSRIERALAGAVDRFVCLTDHAQDKYSAHVPKKKLVRIYNGMNLEKLNPRIFSGDNGLRKQLNISEDAKVVGMVARIVEGKGHREFLHAAAELSSTASKMHFLVIGDGLTEADFLLKAELIDLANRLDLSQKILFTGWRDDARDLMKIMDVFVFPTTFFPEGFGLTCIEAAAQGVPVVATAIPGPSEIVVHGETGFLVPPGSPKEIANAVQGILDDPDLAARFSRAGRARVEALFDVRKIVGQLQSIYEELAPARRT